MTQATGLSGKDGKVEISTDNSTWSDISGWSNSWSIDGFARKLGEAYTFDGDGPAVATGKRERGNIALSFLYTEGASDPAVTLSNAYENTTPYYVRISPTGGGSGEFRWTSSVGYFLEPLVPDSDAAGDGLLTVDTSFTCGTVTRSTVT